MIRRSAALVAEKLGLNRSTVTVIIASLLDQGLVRELDSAPRNAKAHGRPRVGVALAGTGAYFAGMELGNELLTVVQPATPDAAIVGAVSAPPRCGHALGQRRGGGLGCATNLVSGQVRKTA